MRRVKIGALFLILCLCILFAGGCAAKNAAEEHEEIKQEEEITEDVVTPEETVGEEPASEVPASETPVAETPQPAAPVTPTPAPTPTVTTPAPTTTVSQPRPSDKTYYIKVNRLANCVTIYAKDTNGSHTVPVKAMVCSVGKNIYNTPAGVFKTTNKYEWRALYGNQYGQYATRFNGPILFHSVPYSRQSKDTLKTDYYNNLGVGDSMGCVRLTCADAKWIYDNCEIGTIVEVYDSTDPGPLGKPEAVKIDVNSPYAGWDPTDPDVANPWHAVLAPPEESQKPEDTTPEEEENSSNEEEKQEEVEAAS